VRCGLTSKFHIYVRHDNGATGLSESFAKLEAKLSASTSDYCYTVSQTELIDDFLCH
jgi:hypothetical protein